MRIAIQPGAGVSAVRIRELLGAARSRVYARLAHALEFPIALLAAPPGFGKSTVLRDFLGAQGRAYRLLKVAPGATDTLEILRGLAACVADIVPALSSTFVAVHDRVAGAPDEADRLALWAASYLTSLDGLVVIDGLEAMGDGRAAAFVAALVDRTRDVRWVIVSESSEGFPLARWLAEDRIGVPIDAADLALRESDLGATIGADPQSLALRQFREFCALTGGSPGAIVLAMASRAVIDVQTAPREPAELHWYLASAALSTLAAPTREFVERTCFFRSFDSALLDCADIVGVEPILTELCEGSALLSIDHAGAYEYDPRFRRFVVEGLRAANDGSFERSATRSAAAYERYGAHAAAIELDIMLGDRPGLCRLLTAHGYALIDGGEASAVQRALENVPHDILLNFPGALAVKATLESLHGKLDVAEAWFRVALHHIIDDNERNEIAYRFAVDLVRRERPDAIGILEPIVASLDDRTALAAPLCALLASSYASQNRLPQAASMMERALQLLPNVSDRAMRAKIVCQAGFVALNLRDIAAAKAFARDAYDEAIASDTFDVAARALSVSYSIAIDHDDDVAASRVFVAKLATAGERAGSRQLSLYATLCRYELEVYAGNVSEIERLAEQLASLEVFYSVLTTETLLPSQALAATWNGDFYRAYRLLESSAEHQITPDRRAQRYAEIAVYAAAAGLRQAASAAARNARLALRETPFCDKTVLTARAYVALAFVLLRRERRAAWWLRDLGEYAGANPRIAGLVRAVQALAQRWSTGVWPIDFGGVLATLEELDLGGVARMIEAIPLPAPALHDVVDRIA